jgi:hypothetical protein
MTRERMLAKLLLLAAICAVLSAAGGLFWQEPGEPFDFTSVRGATVRMFGRGLYRLDTAFKAPINRGTDAAILALAVPAAALVLVGLRKAGRGSPAHVATRLNAAGVSSVFLYNAAHLTFAVTYNRLALLYIAYFSASLFAFIAAMLSIKAEELKPAFERDFPRRRVAAFLATGGLSVCVWLVEIVASTVKGGAPSNLEPYTAEATYGIDLGVILPVSIAAALLTARRDGLGLLLGYVMMALLSFIGPMVVFQTLSQITHGVRLNALEFFLYVIPFVALGAVALAALKAVRSRLPA